ncbi:MAG: hypothetical protein IPK07_17665 [Deltaproteobacteria bacterium]|jgi:hypothetical protein|nr:hypothetical protein [Deltaproteobacteria bacterium]
MALTCPDCGRANNERLEACLYCGALLPRPEPARAEAAPPPTAAHAPAARAAPAARVDPEPAASDASPWRRHWLLVLDRVSEPPPAPPTPDTVNAVADILGIDAYLARKHLTSRSPSVVARNELPDGLREIGKHLAALGFELTLISPHELASVTDPWHARTLEFAGEKAPPEWRGSVGFGGVDDEVMRVAPGDVLLIVQGTLQVLIPDASGATRGIGSALAWTSPSKEALEELRSDYPLVEIHRAAGPRVRLCLADFDFSGLGDRKRPSSLLNLKLLVREVAAASPAARVDDAFRFLAPEFDAGAGLLGLPSTNEAQFDRYSRTLFLHRRKLAARR